MLQANNLLWDYYAQVLQQLSSKLCQMTGLDQEGLVKIAIAGAFDATSYTEDAAGKDDADVISQTIGDDTAVMHEAEGQ